MAYLSKCNTISYDAFQKNNHDVLLDVLEYNNKFVYMYIHWVHIYVCRYDIPIIRSLGSNLADKMSELREREMRAGRIIIDRKRINKGLNAKRLFSLRIADDDGSDGGGWAASSWILNRIIS